MNWNPGAPRPDWRGQPVADPARHVPTSAEGAYANDWARFSSWCDGHGFASITADPRHVALFLEAEAALGYSPTTIGHRLSAIGHMHRLHDAPPPLAHENSDVIRRAMMRVRPRQQAHRTHPGTTRVLRMVLGSVPEKTLRDIRDRALIALKIAGALRDSELARLSLDRMNHDDHQIQIHLGRGGHHTPEPRDVIVMMNDDVIRPVALFGDWLRRSGVDNGSLFRQLAGSRAIDAPMTEAQIVDAIQVRAAAAGYAYQRLTKVNSRMISDIVAVAGGGRPIQPAHR